ncbi:TauD/TfdA family dioxygenase [Candidatus Nomurabacteria bacterium]|nr:TauD/TfdA family dioxygenase [Candidatus Kaiserbacteria bacterium]MCB9814896.1 TauD/TfdA family dioxygenase [Candidatus Nomurabacteria bacterium]
MKLVVTSNTSLSKEILPFLLENLSKSGWALLQIDEEDEELNYKMLSLSILIGQSLGDSVGYHYLKSSGSNEHLVAHSEGISNQDGIIPYFALCCIKPAESGGETRLFDGRIAAQKVINNSKLEGVKIEYSALAYPELKVIYPLVVNDFDGVLRYRSKVITNKVICSGEISEEEMYKLVDQILEESIIVSHNWQRGDILFVNNMITLHDRLPFIGKRVLIRVRYNDNLNVKQRY